MITIIDYNAGNLRSVQNALQRLGASYIVTSSPAVLAKASKAIFPGVGAAGAAMTVLRKFNLDTAIKGLTVPTLGICLGMQLLFEKCDEDDTQALGILSGTVSRFDEKTGIKVPHMGWNRVKMVGKSILLKGITDESSFYFVHSYVAPVTDDTIGITLYGRPFAAAIQKKNFYGTQFHPEKSGENGINILRNFLAL